MVTTKEISAKLAEAIKQSGIPQAKIAEMIGVTQQQISNYVNGLNLPALDMFSRLCTVLDLEASEILCIERKKEY